MKKLFQFSVDYPVTILMIVLGGLIAALYMAYRLVIRRDYHPHIPIAYGPAILLAATVMLLWSKNVLPW